MTVLTEVQHMGEFLVSEGPGTISRESGILLSGQVVKDGQVVTINGAGKLVAGTGASGEDVVGIVLGNHDATGADKKQVPYIARLAEVDLTLVYAEEVSDAVVDWAALALLNIIPR